MGCPLIGEYLFAAVAQLEAQRFGQEVVFAFLKLNFLAEDVDDNIGIFNDIRTPKKAPLRKQLIIIIVSLILLPRKLIPNHLRRPYRSVITVCISLIGVGVDVARVYLWRRVAAHDLEAGMS